MSTVPATTPIGRLAELGTSAWLDSIRRSMLTGGELERLVREDGVVGVTSNPSIFEQAILGSPDYDERLAELTTNGADVKTIYEDLAVADVQGAADVLRPVYDRTGGVDGYVSLEVAPELARDTEGTLAMARDYWARVDRPNVMIKIPGTAEGVPAIRAAIADGINVNVTLLFSLDAWAAIAEAWLAGLEDRAGAGKPVDGVASVASFFVSRVDTAVDKRLKAIGGDATRLCGTAAVANAQLAYERWRELVAGERFAALREQGARPQRLLWASTGTKDPAYSDVKYVAELAGPETVNTMPLATLLAYQDHGEAAAPLLADAAPSAHAAIDAVEAAGVSLDEVTDELLEAGIDSFANAMRTLLEGIEQRRAAVLAGEPASVEARLTDEQARAIGARAAWAQEQGVLRRVWSKDDSLWAAGDDKPSDRLGWLTIAAQSLEHLDEVQAFAAELRAEGFTDAALLGMGGSSLAPEVLWQTFGASADGGLKLHVLDSTHPDAVAGLQARLPLDRTLFLVSSKSGGTLEPRSMHAHFKPLAPDGRQWAAVTDPGTALETLAHEEGFRHVFHGAPDIGGRYSALSAFGVVPAALIGADVRALLERAEVAARAAEPSLPPGDAPALWLGLALGELASSGRDKLTFVVDPPLRSLGLWLEQLVAESTGKHGKGIVPIADEPLADPDAYGDDRVFVHLRRTDGQDEACPKLDALADAGHPVIHLPFETPADLGAIFFHAELAVAVAGAVIGINAFDQPNVQAAKDLTVATIEAYVRDGAFPAADAGSVSGEEAAAALRALLDEHAGAGSYVATMAYLAPDPAVDEALTKLRTAVRARTRAATTVGYGPRFLHSTGQLHKGGPKTGVFLQFVDTADTQVDIPGQRYDFAALVRAQAIGDGQALRSHDLPFLRVELPAGGAAAAIAALADALA
jgi:transaldolase/glucose-6-phosphate isomerase